MKKINKKGFTLVELLLVIAIIGILAAVLFVSLGKQRERARMTTFKENMRGLVTAATSCRDGGGTALAVQGAAVCSDATLGIGNIPTMDDCDGSGNPTLAIATGGTDSWTYTGTCVKSSGNCVATCNVNGCTYAGCE
jgi:prepilin-type N-terminal cleavage/methylation domain-containing protein